MTSPRASAQVSRCMRAAGRHPLAVAFLAALALGVTATLLLPRLFVVMAWTLAGLIGMVLAAGAIASRRATTPDQGQPVRRTV